MSTQKINAWVPEFVFIFLKVCGKAVFHLPSVYIRFDKDITSDMYINIIAENTSLKRLISYSLCLHMKTTYCGVNLYHEPLIFSPTDIN